MTDTPWAGHGQPDQPPPGYVAPGQPRRDGQPPFGSSGQYGQPPFGSSGQYGPAGQPGGWNRAGASAPGGIPLRPLGISDILSGSFTLVRQNPGATLGLTASVVATMAVAVFLTVVASHAVGALALLAVPVGLGLAALQLGGLSAAMGRSLLGRKLSIADAVRQSRAGWTVLAMLLLVLVCAAVWVPLIALLKGWGVIPALGLTAWLAVMLSLTIPVVVLERRGPLAAVARSWRLVSGSYWRAFGTYLLTWFLAWAISFVISLPLGFATGLAGGLGSGSKATVSLTVIMYAIGEIVIVSLTATIETGVVVLVYADMRMRKEGMDLVLQHAAQNQRLTGDEFASTGLPSAYPGGAYPGGAYGGAYYTGEYANGYPGYPGDPGHPGDPTGPPAV